MKPSVVIYSLDDEIFNRPFDEIPYYRNGAIIYLPQEVKDQYEEGHQPWLGTGIDVVTTATSNLSGQEKPYLDLSYEGDIRKTGSGIVIKSVTNRLVELHVPHVGRYRIELRSPPGTTILFIRKIEWFPASEEP
jgi:hypothetical protein